MPSLASKDNPNLDQARVRPTALKVLHVIPSVAPRYGGPSRVVTEMCRALRASGVEATIVTTDGDGPGHLRVPLGRVVEYNGVPTRFFRRQGLDNFQYSPGLHRWLDAHTPDFDVLHIHAIFSYPCLVAARACQRHEIPYVIRPLGSLDPWSLRQSRLRKRVLWHLGVQQMLHRATVIHYTAREEQRLAESVLPSHRSTVIPLGVDEDIFAAPVSASEFRAQFPSLGGNPYVLTLSRLHPKKGLDLLVRAFAAIRERPRLSAWRLVIAGDGDPAYVSDLKALAVRTALHGESGIVFTGWLEGRTKRAALAHAALFALPSWQENFGLAALEAMASSTPVLVSEHVNLAPEIAASSAGWVTALNPQSLRDTLYEALADPEERVRRGAAGQALARQDFSWHAASSQLQRLYWDICGERVRAFRSIS